MTRPFLLAVALLTSLCVVAASRLPARAADPSEQRLIRLEVTIGRSQVVDLKDSFTRVSVTNPAVADVFVVTPNQILVNGKTVGVTSLVVFYPDRTVFFDVVVHTDTELLRERLRQVAPRDNIEVHAARDAIVLTGSVSSSAVSQAAVEIASVFARQGKVVNLMGLTDVKPQQVMLQVQVGEVNRAALKELGFNIRALGSTLQAGFFPGVPFTPALGALGLVTASGSAVGRSTPDFAFDGSNFFLSSGQRDYAGVIRALAERDLFRTLAKPNLVTQSGTEAKFISGGEFPYPVSSGVNQISIEFKEFGIGLVFRPVVTDGETITMTVRPEVSSLDFSQGLISAGIAIPVIRKNETFTTINIKDGESFAIAGLINNDVRQAVAKIPVLGDIPILGALFRSVRFRNNESELLFVVTVKLVRPTQPGVAAADPTRLMELRDADRREFTLLPGIPGVGEVVERPFGSSSLEPR
jgi:pilus assembly protein CpaC